MRGTPGRKQGRKQGTLMLSGENRGLSCFPGVAMDTREGAGEITETREHLSTGV
jgi:hypothetical protein